MDLPKNILVHKLPDHQGFNNFPTKECNSDNEADINGKAVSIECFLDFGDMVPWVTWTSFNKTTKTLQGSISDKQKKELQNRFRESDLTPKVYDVTKLRFLIDSIIDKLVKPSSN